VVRDHNDDYGVCNIHHPMAYEEMDFVPWSISLDEVEEGVRTTSCRS
jgi:hypothetical protein